MTFTEKLTAYINACYPALWITTHEENRVVKEVKKEFEKPAARGNSGCSVYEWNCIDGLVHRTMDNKVKSFPDTTDPMKLFPKIAAECKIEHGEDSIFILKDFHLQFEKPLKKPDYVTSFKVIQQVLKARRCIVLFIAPVVKIPNELSKDIQVLDYQLPDEIAISKKLDFVVDSLNVSNAGAKGKAKHVVTEEIKDLAIEAAKGLTDSEIESAFSLAIVETKEFNRAFVNSVFSEKINQIKKGGLLTHLESDVSFDNVGGLSQLKEWIRTRREGFSKRAREYGLPFPKGLGLAGIPGCGKTLTSKAVSNEFGFPLFQLDLGSLFSKYVGETEQNFINMIKTVDSIGRCVILIDEIEKYLNSGATSGTGDSGTGSRSFGTLLSWLNDRKNPAFIIYTSNNHLALPPELTRKGRFDELFWIDLPTQDEREDIFKVVIKKYNRVPAKFDCAALAKATGEFTGSEIDNLFKDAMFKAFSENKEIDQSYVLSEIADTTPQSKINVEQISTMRNKVRGKLRPAAPYDYEALVSTEETETRKIKA